MQTCIAIIHSSHWLNQIRKPLVLLLKFLFTALVKFRKKQRRISIHPFKCRKFHYFWCTGEGGQWDPPRKKITTKGQQNTRSQEIKVEWEELEADIITKTTKHCIYDVFEEVKKSQNYGLKSQNPYTWHNFFNSSLLFNNSTAQGGNYWFLSALRTVMVYFIYLSSPCPGSELLQFCSVLFVTETSYTHSLDPYCTTVILLCSLLHFSY